MFEMQVTVCFSHYLGCKCVYLRKKIGEGKIEGHHRRSEFLNWNSDLYCFIPTKANNNLSYNQMIHTLAGKTKPMKKIEKNPSSINAFFTVVKNGYS